MLFESHDWWVLIPFLLIGAFVMPVATGVWLVTRRASGWWVLWAMLIGGVVVFSSSLIGLEPMDGLEVPDEEWYKPVLWFLATGLIGSALVLVLEEVWWRMKR